MNSKTHLMLSHFTRVCVLLFLFSLSSCDKNEDFDDDEKIIENGTSNLKGTGSFIFKDYAPLASSPVNIYYHIPANSTNQSKIIIVFHGANRDARQSRDALLEKANQYNAILVVPEFSETYYPGGDAYNLGNIFVDGDNPSSASLNPEEKWTFSIVEPLFAFVKEITSNKSEKYDVIGFSAGAQFAHRLLFFKPNSKVNQLVVAAAGWYTMPNSDIDFPYGLSISPFNSSDFSTIFSAQLTIIIGARDIDPNAPGLRRNVQADEQGNNRWSRANYFYNESKSIAEKKVLSFNWEFDLVSNTGHDFTPMAIYAIDNVIFN